MTQIKSGRLAVRILTLFLILGATVLVAPTLMYPVQKAHADLPLQPCGSPAFIIDAPTSVTTITQSGGALANVMITVTFDNQALACAEGTVTFTNSASTPAGLNCPNSPLNDYESPANVPYTFTATLTCGSTQAGDYSMTVTVNSTTQQVGVACPAPFVVLHSGACEDLQTTPVFLVHIVKVEAAIPFPAEIAALVVIVAMFVAVESRRIHAPEALA